MATCRLCFPPKVTRWHEANDDFIVMDCPACGELLIVFRRHTDDRTETDAKKIGRKFLGNRVEIVEKDCFHTAHPHYHVRKAEEKRKTREEPQEEQHSPLY